MTHSMLCLLSIAEKQVILLCAIIVIQLFALNGVYLNCTIFKLLNIFLFLLSMCKPVATCLYVPGAWGGQKKIMGYPETGVTQL